MKPLRPDLAALAVCVVIVIGMVALAYAHVTIPDVFPYLATAALSAGAGVALNYTGSSTSTAQKVAEEATAIVAAAVPTPRTAVDQPIATHAP